MALAPSLPLLGVPSAAISARSSPTWSAGSRPTATLASVGVDVGDRLGHAFAQVALLVAVAELDRLVDSRAGSGGNRRPPKRAVGQDHVHFDGWVAAAVEDLATNDSRDGRRLATHGDRQTPDRRRLAKSLVLMARRTGLSTWENVHRCHWLLSDSSLTRFIRFEPTAVKSAVTLDRCGRRGKSRFGDANTIAVFD